MPFQQIWLPIREMIMLFKDVNYFAFSLIIVTVRSENTLHVRSENAEITTIWL